MSGPLVVAAALLLGRKSANPSGRFHRVTSMFIVLVAPILAGCASNDSSDASEEQSGLLLLDSRLLHGVTGAQAVVVGDRVILVGGVSDAEPFAWQSFLPSTGEVRALNASSWNRGLAWGSAVWNPASGRVQVAELASRLEGYEAYSEPGGYHADGWREHPELRSWTYDPIGDRSDPGQSGYELRAWSPGLAWLNSSWLAFGGIQDNSPVDLVVRLPGRLEVAHMPMPVSQAQTVAVEDSVYVVLGRTTDDVSHEILRYDDASSQVLRMNASLPAEYEYDGTETATDGKDLYFFGVARKTDNATLILRYDSRQDAIVLEPATFPHALHHPAVAWMNDVFYVLGGSTDAQASMEIWRYRPA